MAYIRLQFQSDIIYVAGTINDVETVWQYINGAWYGYADAAPDSTYVVWVEMYDAAGNRSEYTDTLYYELPWFVTDRTQNDVDNGTAKGFLNASDLNRIEKNSYTIGNLVAIPVTAKQDWEIGDLPRASDYARIREQVQKLRDFVHRQTTPEVPESPLNTYQKYNDVEQIQKDCFDSYVGNMKNVIYAGEIYAGEGGYL